MTGIDFQGKTVLITGASLGIGAALARAFAAAGANVGIGYNRSEAEALHLIGELTDAGRSAIPLKGDVTDPAVVERIIEETVSAFGTVDVLINNAGALISRSAISDASDDLYESIMALNMRSMFQACRAVIPVMTARGGGNIINLSSIAARTGGSGGSVLYAASKGAVATFTRGLAVELAPVGIRVNALSPGLIATPFHEGGTTDPEVFKRLAQAIPMGRAGTAEECVGGALFLASDELSSYVTGQILEVNGGSFRP